MRAIADAGPLIHLSWVDQLGLVDRLFDEVVVPLAVREEVLAARPGTLGLDRLQSMFEDGRLQVRAPAEPTIVLVEGLDLGETEALRLAADSSPALLLTDDLPARMAAERQSIPTTGTIGILVQARMQGLLQEALPVVLELRRLGQWMSDSLVQLVRDLEVAQSS